MTSSWIRIGIAVVVGFVWAASYAVSIVNHAYHPPPEINAVMLLVAGYFFASGIRQEGESARQEQREELRELLEQELQRHDPAEKQGSGPQP